MKTVKLARILLSASSFLIVNESYAITCPGLTKTQLGRVCRTQQAERLGMIAHEIEEEGVRFINDGSCNTLDSILTTLKIGNEKIPGEFRAGESTIEPGHLKSSGKCVYKIKKIIGGTSEIALPVASQQKLIEGIPVHPLAGKTPPKIGQEKVVNPDHHEKLPTIGESIVGVFKGKPKDEPKPSHPVQGHEDELKAKLEEKRASGEDSDESHGTKPPRPQRHTPMHPPSEEAAGVSHDNTPPRPQRPVSNRDNRHAGVFQPVNPGQGSGLQQHTVIDDYNPQPHSPSSKPPTYPPPQVPPRRLPDVPQEKPPVPSRVAQNNEGPQDFKSELDKRLAERQKKSENQ